MEIDADKKILDWCGHLSVPRWDDEKAYNACLGCSAKMDGMFGKGKHHCRLCGKMYCASCTAKYHVPLIFRQAVKNKEGPARVCMSCVDGCMKEKERASAPAGANGAGGASSSSSSLLSSSLTSMAARAVEIAPPAAWEEESAFVCCPKCSATKGSTHNCRVCGLLYCDKCTSKMEIPACFERKKHKTGPTRVCDSCRFKIKSGAKLVEKLSAGAGAPGSGATKGPPPPPPGFLGHQRRPSSFASKCSTAGCTAATAAADGKCGAHTGIKSGESAEARPTIVKREGDGSTVAQLHVPSGDTPLSTIDVLLKKTAPQGEAYSYVFRGAPIPEAFFGVFLAKHLGNTLLIRPKRSGANGSAAIGAAFSGPLESLHEEDEDAGVGGAGGVSAHNNPFKRDLAKEAALAQQRAERARPRPVVAAPQFKRPIAKTVVRFPSGAAAAPKPKPPPVPGSAGAGAGGAASALAAGVSVDTVFKQRAKALFGQL